MLRRSFDWFCRDRRTGRIVIGQWPNWSLATFGILAVISIVAPHPVSLWADVLSRIALAIWAADELLRGVNPWRRCLGAGVLILLAMRLLAGIG